MQSLPSKLLENAVEAFASLPGIGKKTAERVVLELRDKIVRLTGVDSSETKKGSVSGDEIDALMALGYSMSQAREALKSIDENIKDSVERIREALK